MLKKTIAAGSAICLLSTLTIGFPLFSYAKCGLDWLKTSASEAVPLEWEIKRARQMIAELKPEIEDNAHRIAREKVQISKLKKQHAEASEGLAEGRDQIERLTNDLKQGSDQYTYAGTTYTSVQVKSDLASRFKRLKTKTETADKLNQILKARETSLKTTQDRMSSMMLAKRQLEVEIENLQARLGALRVAETNGNVKLDDSHLARTRDLLDEIAIRIDVHEESLAVDSEYFDQIDLDEPTDDYLLDEVAEFLHESVKESHSGSLVAIQLD